MSETRGEDKSNDEPTGTVGTATSQWPHLHRSMFQVALGASFLPHARVKTGRKEDFWGVVSQRPAPLVHVALHCHPSIRH